MSRIIVIGNIFNTIIVRDNNSYSIYKYKNIDEKHQIINKVFNSKNICIKHMKINNIHIRNISNIQRHSLNSIYKIDCCLKNLKPLISDLTVDFIKKSSKMIKYIIFPYDSSIYFTYVIVNNMLIFNLSCLNL